MKVDSPGKTYFPGLNSLRFFAAFFVLIGHIPMNQGSVGLPAPSYGALFFRGEPAVSFFFALSGFLITYLLLEELRKTGDVHVRSFYLRRVCRIWPLYFLIVFFGLFFYNVLLPRIGIHYPVEYNLSLALLLYTFLLPNLMNSLYTVGGILNPLWSIGVEEQFYLTWAPVVKRFHRLLPRICWGVLTVSLIVSCLSVLDVFGQHAMKKFTGQLEIHYMAAGALCAWALARHRERFLALPVFTSRPLQVVLFVVLLDFYLFNFLSRLIPWGWFGEEFLQVLLYPWLIVTVAANPRNVIRVETRAFEYLGTISYGFYMFHMIAVYMTSATFKAWRWWEGSFWLYCAAFYLMAFGLTVLLAHLSYRWFERPFLRLKDRRFSAAPHPLAPSPTPSQPPGEGETILEKRRFFPLARSGGGGGRGG